MSKSIQEWSEELALFTDGTERLMYLVELAKKSTTLPRELRTDDGWLFVSDMGRMVS